jgi:polyisoprenoid-binding protein YceI
MSTCPGTFSIPLHSHQSLLPIEKEVPMTRQPLQTVPARALRGGSGAATATLDRPSVSPGRWTVDAAASSLQIRVKVGFVATVTGRFTEVQGDVDLTADGTSSSIRVAVPSSSLTSGSSHWDTVMRDAGLVDVDAAPTIWFASTALNAEPDGWSLDGMLSTDRGVQAVHFSLSCLGENPDRLRFRATGSISSRDAVRLLSRPGVDRLIGRTMAVDLVVDAVPEG